VNDSITKIIPLDKVITLNVPELEHLLEEKINIVTKFSNYAKALA
jgi:hydroxymethylpyrimidine/phosphomethylpyrimidine kinase